MLIDSVRKHVDLYPLRYRPASGDDPDYDALGYPPNTGVYTLASGEAGDLVHRLVDLRGNTIAELTVAFNTDEATTASDVVDAMNDAVAVKDSVWSRYVHAAIYPGSGDVYYVHYKVNARPFRVELDTPGSMTNTATPGDRWPQAVAIYGSEDRPGDNAITVWEFKVRVVDSNGDFVANAGTYTYEILQGDIYVDPPSKEEKWSVGTRGTGTGTVGEYHRVAVANAHEISVRLSGISGVSGSQIVIDAHPVLE